MDLSNILQQPEEMSLVALSPSERVRYAGEYGRLAQHCLQFDESRLVGEIEAIQRVLLEA